jgi:peptide/nickel transport system permease protein
VAWAIPTLIFITLVSFAIIQLPPGDYLTAYQAKLRETGEELDELTIQRLRERYALDKPFYLQYWRWISNIIREGDFGRSMEWNLPVSQLLWERVGLTVAVTLFTVLFTWILAIPIGVYSATHQYSALDYIMTFVSFMGRGIPSFLLALIVMWVGFAYFGADVGGLFSQEYLAAPWSWGRLVDLLKHIWVPVIVLGVTGTAGLIRTMRANMLDELHKPYVTTARAKGLSEGKVVRKYPMRVAMNPFVSTVGWLLPSLISGSTITATVLNLPTTGPLLLRALLSQDMYLAGSFIMILSIFTVLGTLISDILLAWLDPRIRLV